MKPIYSILLFILLSLPLSGQTLEEKLVEITCACMNETREQLAQGESDRVLLDRCFSKYIEEYQPEFVQRMEEEESDLDYPDFAFKVLMDIQEELVDNCDPYYKMLSQEMDNMVAAFEIQLEEISLENLNTEIAAKPTVVNLSHRGIKLYMAKQYETAEIDFNEAMKLDPKNPMPRTWLGFMAMKQEDYQKSLEVFSKAKEETNEYGFIMFTALVKRKLAEKK
ncbi:MAG: hypothetical protein AAFP76_11510 [Bacteroidota bacterium]